MTLRGPPALVLAGLVAVAGQGRAAEATSGVRFAVWADRDDDDADGRPDAEETPLPLAARADLVPLDPHLVGSAVQILSGGEHARIIVGQGSPWPWGTPPPNPAWLQGLSPGRVELAATTGRGTGATIAMRVTIDVHGIDVTGGTGEVVDMARSHASLERTPPTRIEGRPDAAYDDPDALRVVMTVPADATDGARERVLSAESVTSLGERLDFVPRIALVRSPCARNYDGTLCWSSAPLRLVVDAADRNHPLVGDRSLIAEVGGAIVFRDGGRKAQMIRVLGPRSSPIGPMARFRATLRPFVMRMTGGGPPAIGGTDAGAVNALRAELVAAAAIWGQCGVTFGDPRHFDVRLPDPPPSHLVAIGDELGVPASGGEIRFRAAGRTLMVRTAAGDGPDRVASNLARVAERAGLSATISPNARIAPGWAPSVDVSIRQQGGTLVAVDRVPGRPLSSDGTLSVRIGSVDLGDGLQHFTDVDAVAGTLEERTLLKALDDGDPTTIEVVVVPLFAGGGRIGESFIGSDVSSLRNVVLLDRAGIRATKSTSTLAHELGHVLMDLPGHPDDFIADTPTLLMDSDAADASPFGPRRIPIDECARAIRQSGPGSRTPLLVPWPIAPIPTVASRPVKAR
ncbi:MAG: hypothetical protein M3O50_00420 [Myxococcota bacterium]|nr:hypothetical protein [Myxococcota bacterium]